ncbi:ArsB/NhaD family transporter [Deinococcus soli (ex Cha et al. 2016)]|uniref:Na+/H+ antiporter NhaD/arsenite permease-like protein n=2 Tax=Deinococcus soli (ex Cha et al. 2016) TaxID=1309411 RepID=A0ACC6KMY3_9DEIO|nr:ArsB/NhaD family transporter [Deinococcus soli (ex Cha et al. 2016)]MDR6220883.1 Na+/H+ antiporter NhaD/arsenite permease-like protein [Deinococcus soli (ex Cha et al. 2016)]MDR6330877.1 Na+/H+ antiporter NhaD/arsenite permease-like protein [Deinococcus soli (ex Cha et al. 2016)]MDR6753982.1 Na+/H+ antiporter NhaD/arsenite permease-like protein [Deinococcus soli (ex Cha et al. 2016)]
MHEGSLLHLPAAWQAPLAIGLFIATYALILAEKCVHRTVAALLGACAVMLLGLLAPDQAWGAIDFNTLFLLFGMMNIVNVLSRSGFFDLVARRALLLTRGEPVRVLWIFSGLTALFSAFLDNVTTVLFMAPVVVTVVTRLGLRPVPFLIAIILASNTGGTATLVGDPPNIIIGSVAEKGFGDFLVNVAPFAAVACVTGIALMQLLMTWRGDLSGFAASDRLQAALQDAPTPVVNRRLMTQALAVFAVTLVLFMVGHPLGLEAGLIALTTSTFLLLIADLDPVALFEQVEWATLLFFMGLFVVVGALEHAGVFKQAASALTAAMGGDIGTGILLIGLGSALISGFVDNIPFTISMASVLRELQGTLGAGIDPLWWALSLGACLGGNLTLIGASANIVVADIAAREGHPISFGGFMRYATPITVITVLLAVGLFYGAHRLGVM